MLLGKEAKLLAMQTNCDEEEFESFTSVNSCTGSVSVGTSFSDRELDKELYITAIPFKRIVLTWFGHRERMKMEGW